MRRVRRLVLPCVAAAAVFFAACGGESSDGGEDADAPPAEVTIEDSRYLPQELTVPIGTEVTFTNLDRATHTVTVDEDGPGEFDSGDLGLEEQFRHTFTESGTYDYFCEVHPTMRASVVVEDG